MLRNPLRGLRFRSTIRHFHHMSAIKMSFSAWGSASRHQNRNFFRSFSRSNLISRVMVAVAVDNSNHNFPQVLPIELHFVRKGGSLGATQNRTFSPVFDDRTSYRARLSRFLIVRGHRPRLNREEKLAEREREREREREEGEGERERERGRGRGRGRERERERGREKRREEKRREKERRSEKRREEKRNEYVRSENVMKTYYLNFFLEEPYAQALPGKKAQC